MTQKVKVEFIGGPLDGLVRTLDDPPEWVWMESADKTAFRRPKVGREPYYAVQSVRPEAELRKDPRVSYLYAGHTHRVCPGCGGLHARHDGKGKHVEECGFCAKPFPEAA